MQVACYFSSREACDGGQRKVFDDDERPIRSDLVGTAGTGSGLKRWGRRDDAFCRLFFVCRCGVSNAGGRPSWWILLAQRHIVVVEKRCYDGRGVSSSSSRSRHVEQFLAKQQALSIKDVLVRKRAGGV